MTSRRHGLTPRHSLTLLLAAGLLSLAAACSTSQAPPTDGALSAGAGAPLSAPPLSLPAPRELYRATSTFTTIRHLPAVQCESLALNFSKVTFDQQAQQAIFAPTGDTFGDVSFMMLPFAIGDLDRDGLPDLAFTLDGTRSQDDGTLQCFIGIGDYGNNTWQWRESSSPSISEIVVTKVSDKASPTQQLIIVVCFFGGGVFNADSVDLRPVDVPRWPAETIAAWDAPEMPATHAYCQWDRDPYVEDALRCFYVDTSGNSLYVGSANGGVWKTSNLTPEGDSVRAFSQCGFADGSVRLAYFDAAHFQLKVLKGDHSYEPAAFTQEYFTLAGGGTLLTDSYIHMIEDTATGSPRIVFHDEALGGLRFAEPGAIPGELALTPVSDLPDVGKHCKVWLPANFRILCTDETTTPQIVQFDFDAAMGWQQSPVPTTAMPFTSPPGAMDSFVPSADMSWAAYSCPHGIGLVQWTPDSKGSSGLKGVSKTFVAPHVFETKGSAGMVTFDRDSNGKPCVAGYFPNSHEIGFAQWDPDSSSWTSEIVTQLPAVQDCDDLDLVIEPDLNGDGFCDAAVLSACREAASQPATMHWVLEVRVQRIEMK